MVNFGWNEREGNSLFPCHFVFRSGMCVLLEILHTRKKKTSTVYIYIYTYKRSVLEPRCLKILNPCKALCLQQAGEPRYRRASYHLMMQSCGLRIRRWNVAPERFGPDGPSSRSTHQ